MRIKIPFTGMTSEPTYKDGACRTLVNLRPKNGVHKPVAPRKVLHTFTDDYDIVFIHKGNDYERWLGAKGHIVYSDIKGAPVVLATLPENVNGIEQVGNTLSFITDSNIYYALHKDNRYTYLGELPEIPKVEFLSDQKMQLVKKFNECPYISLK